MELNLKYNLHDKVKILPCELEGRIIAITITKDGYEYNVKYYADKEPKVNWFFEDELELLKEQKGVGF